MTVQEIEKISHQHQNHIKEYYETQVIRKHALKVVFIAIHKSTWKVDSVFLKMLEDPFFAPMVLVAPYTVYGKEVMHYEMEQTFAYFKTKGYPVIKSKKEDSNDWIDIKELNPDIIFFTNPHYLTKKRYYEDAFLNYISYYVPYYYQISKHQNYQLQYNQFFHNAMYKIFTPHHVAKTIHEQFSDNKGKNVVVTGYPAMEPFMDKQYPVKDIWKEQSKKKIRIIWAPHHTIETPELPYSNFLKYYNFFQKIALRYVNEIQWAFKPHPILKTKLFLHPEWGKERTEAYWDFWENSSFSQLEEGEYIDLFLTSDAMIHDSCSFLVEYMHVCKPVLYLNSCENIQDFFNSFGHLALNACEHACSTGDIENFIKQRLENIDLGRSKREDFLEKNIFPLFNHQYPSAQIIEIIKKDFSTVL